MLNAQNPSIQSPMSAATLSLIGAVACLAAFLPPLSERVFGSVLFIVAVSLGLAVCIVLHLVFVGILAERLGRSSWLWVLLALLTFPIGSVIGLVLLHWRANEAATATPASPSS